MIRKAGDVLWRTPGTSHLTPALRSRWRDALAEWNAPPAARASLEQLTVPGTRVVVTGQQPGPWGGPLYALYKAATAVALAEHIREAGHPAVAVFWVQGDDTDWDEVAWGTLPFPDLRLFRHRWSSSGPSRRWVGNEAIAAPAEVRELLAAWGAPDLLFGPRDAGEELSTTFLRALLDALGGRGLLPLDARWPEVRAAGELLWRSYLPKRDALRQAVEEATIRLAARGEPTPLEGAALGQGLFVLDGAARRPVDPATWAGDAEAMLHGGEPERVAPSVLLRAPLQDHLFGTAAHVVGDTEAAYLRQLEPIYEALDIAVPARVPRLSATVLPAGLIPPEAARECLEDPERWIAAQARRAVPDSAVRALDGLRSDVNRHLAAFREGTRGLGKDVDEIEDAARKKIDREIARLEDTLDRRGRQQVYRQAPALRYLGEFLAPRRGPQERGLSAASLAFLLGESAMAVVGDAAHSHLARLARGERHHVVLEGTS